MELNDNELKRISDVLDAAINEAVEYIDSNKITLKGQLKMLHKYT